MSKWWNGRHTILRRWRPKDVRVQLPLWTQKNVSVAESVYALDC